MSKYTKILNKVLEGTSDKNILFDELRNLLTRLEFKEKVKGSHHIYTKIGVNEIINLQPVKTGKAKAYQVKQVRNLILKYQIGGSDV